MPLLFFLGLPCVLHGNALAGLAAPAFFLKYFTFVHFLFFFICRGVHKIWALVTCSSLGQGFTVVFVHGCCLSSVRIGRLEPPHQFRA